MIAYLYQACQKINTIKKSLIFFPKKNLQRARKLLKLFQVIKNQAEALQIFFKIFNHAGLSKNTFPSNTNKTVYWQDILYLMNSFVAAMKKFGNHDPVDVISALNLSK